jgi:hypothetical protein
MSEGNKAGGPGFRLRSAAEPGLFVGLALLYIWVIQPTRSDWLRVPVIAGAAVIVGIGLLAGEAPRARPGIVSAFLLYPFWGLAQQYAMQSFTFRRFREATGGPAAAAALTAVFFAAAHYPNMALALVTGVGGFFWCLLFQRHANLLTLALSHGWLAVLLRASWPAEWLHNLRIGPSFWSWTP